MADEEKVGESESDGNETNLLNFFASKKSTGAGYLNSVGTKKGGVNLKRGSGNTKNSVKAARKSNYLTLYVKKAFNHLQHTFTQAPILQHFDSKRHIRIETEASSYAIGKVLSQLILDDLG